MKYTYSIQKVSFYADEYEDKGPVDVDGAIDAFEKFPFEEQLKERIESEIVSAPFPSLLLQDEDGHSLSISAQDDTGFYLHYQSADQYADIYISNNYELNPQGYSPDEFIGYFFEGKIEASLEDFLLPLESEDEAQEDEAQEDDAESEEEVEAHDSKKQKYSYQFSEPSKLKYIGWPMIYFALALLFVFLFMNMGLTEGKWGVFILVEVLYSLIWLPSFILFITYYRNDDGVSIEIDKTQKTLTYTKEGEIILIHRDDIDHCRIFRFARGYSRSYELERFSYLYIVLKDSRRISITSFITEPETIAGHLHLKYELVKGSWPAFL